MSIQTPVLYILLSWLTVIYIPGQDKYTRIKNQLAAADTVLLVQRQPRQTFLAYMKPEEARSLGTVTNGRINKAMIIRSYALKKADIPALATIIGKPATGKLENYKCFIPRHAVVLIKNRTATFIDFCFQCKNLESSAQVGMISEDFDDRKWKELEKLFSARGLIEAKRPSTL